ncbi:MFS transporter [Paenibacillus sp. MBLB4367]|uniref:MFS transporter n=1 Tax=Paenibacillus sp. MBLB4367 TaxID=3384767 RepID=UPI003908139F
MSSISASAGQQARHMTVFSVLFMISSVHLLNDAIQSVVPAMFPILHETLQLSFSQIGLIGFALNITASILQPLIGLYTDAKPKPYLLPIGILFTLAGVVGLAFAPSFAYIMLAVILIGIGSSVLHPESSRVAYLAAGDRRGLAQSIFQVGGNMGQALAPVMTALIFVPLGQKGIIWFAIAAIVALIIQTKVARWYQANLVARPKAPKGAGAAKAQPAGARGWIVGASLGILLMLLFSKFVYVASMTGFYSFYAIDKFGISVDQAQLILFALLLAGMVGTFLGGPMADRFGRRNMIWFSILGTAPFSLLLPYASSMLWAVVLCICIGFILMSGFSVIVVYAQELLPNKVGTVSGLVFGVSFGLGGVGSAVLGKVADVSGIAFVIEICAYLPLLGVLAAFLPTDRKLHALSAVPEGRQAVKG